MKKFNIFLSLFSLIFILVASCNVEVVEAPSAIEQTEKSKAACVINLLGIVSDANTLQPIEGAIVKLGSKTVTTKKDGKYLFKVSEFLDTDSIGLVVVNKTGYILSNYQFSIKKRVDLTLCKGNEINVIQDFPLSKILSGIKITSAGGQFTANAQIGGFNNKGEQVTSNFDFIINVPAGAVDQDTYISVSPLSERTLLGLPSDTVTIAGFNLSPSSVELKSPISIIFKPNTNLTAKTRLFPLYLDEVKNKLVAGNGQVSYDFPGKLITLVVNKMGSFFVGTNIPLLVTGTKNINSEIAFGQVENCNCGSLNIKTTEYSVPSINFAGLDISGRDKVLKFLNINYDPTNTTKISSDVTVSKCSVRAYSVTANKIVISGYFGTQPWELTRYDNLSIQPKPNATKNCPVNTPCHQGCPQ